MAKPTAREQLLLELVNRARLDPLAEAERYFIDLNAGLSPGTISSAVKAPLAMNDFLVDAARSHSQWMLDTDIFSHTGVSGSTPGQRMSAAGYVFSGSWTWGENISWSGSTGSIDLTQAISTHHQGLFLSSGHRVNMLNPDFVEFGSGQRDGQFTSDGTIWNASMLTETFARTGSRLNILTGVVYRDTDHNDFYSVGEGVENIQVAAGGSSTTTYAAGGYALGGIQGTVSVTFSGAALTAPVSATVVAPGGNVKLDLVDGSVFRSSVDTSLGSGATGLILLGNATTGTGNELNNVITGTRFNNTLRGGGGNDILIGTAGTNQLDGGPGTDTAQYAGPRSQYTISAVQGGYSVSGAGSNDILANIEFIAFSDQTITISTSPSNTAPTLAIPTPPSYTDTSADDTFTTASGTLIGSDPDPGTVLVYGISGGTTAGGVTTKTGTYGTLNVTTATGAWTFVPNDPAIESLKTAASDSYTVTVSDGTLGASRPFVVTILGTNDLPTVFGGTTTGAVSKNGTVSVAGTLTAADRDAGDAAIVASANVTGTYGTFGIAASGAWTYALNNAASNVQALTSGQTVTDTFSVGTAGGATQHVVISVSGADSATPDRVNGVSIGDAGNTLATAANLTGSCTITGNTGNAGDTDDYFKFVAAAAGTVTLSLTGLTADIDLRLLDSSGTQLTSSTLGGTTSESLSLSVTPGATYYILIDPYLSAASNYSLAVTLPAAQPIDDGTLQTARNVGALGAPKIFNDSIGGTDTADYYAFTVTRKGTFDLLMSGMSSDADVALLNTTGSTLVVSQNSGTTAENISRILDPGTYYVKVYPYSGSTNYTLSLSTTVLDERFSEYFYLLNNPDVAGAVKAGVLASGWQHFVLSGWLEGRDFTTPANYGDFNEDFYLLRNPDVAGAVRAGFLASGWQHFDLFGRSEGRSYAQPVGYGSFNEDLYLLNNPDVAGAVRAGVLSSGWQHYSLCGQSEGRSYAAPPGYGNFNEDYYLLNNPDVARVVQAGYLSSGWQHFDLCGRAEGRGYAEPPGYAAFNEIYYLTNNPDVAAAVRAGVFMTGWQHYSSCGQAEGRSAAGLVPVGQTTQGAQIYLGDDGLLHFAADETAYDFLSEGQTTNTQFAFRAFGGPGASGPIVSAVVTGHVGQPDEINLAASGMLSAHSEEAVLMGVGYNDLGVEIM